MAEKLDPLDVAMLERSLNDSATRVSAIWVSFLVFGLYLLIAAVAVEHRQLFLAESVKLPVLNVDLSILGFFVLAPFLVVIFHAYVLMQVILLGRTAAAYNEAVERANLPAKEEASVRQRLMNTLFAQIFAGSPGERGGWLGFLLKGMAWITLAFAPILILGVFQFKFLPYHSSFITWAHRVLISLELIVLFFIWPLVLHAQSEFQWPKVRAWPVLLAGCLLYVAVSLSVLTFPGEPHVNLVTGPWPNDVQCERWFQREFKGISDLRFDRLVLPHADLIDHDKLTRIRKATEEAGEQPYQGERTRILRGRDLNCADFQNFTDLRRVDLADAHLKYANLITAKLEGTSLVRAQLQGANLNGANLQSASLREANLQHATLANARLQHASLYGADLQFTNLSDANLQGASLDGAMLQGSGLKGARLQGATFRRAKFKEYGYFDPHLRDWIRPAPKFKNAQLQGASLDDAFLQGASLDNAELQGASLMRAQLQGTSFNGAQLQGASLIGAQLQGSTLQSSLAGGWADGLHFTSVQFLGVSQFTSAQRPRLPRSSFVKAQLKGASLDGAKLDGADFGSSPLDYATFLDAHVWRTRNANACITSRVNNHRPNTNMALTVVPTRDEIMKFIEHSVSDIPEGVLKKEARERMRRGLLVDPDKDDTEIIEKTWIECEQASAKPTREEFNQKFDQNRAEFLRKLVCEDAKNVALARGIIRNWIDDTNPMISQDHERREFSSRLARLLLGNECPPTKQLDKETKEVLHRAAKL